MKNKDFSLRALAVLFCLVSSACTHSNNVWESYNVVSAEYTGTGAIDPIKD